MVLSKKNNALHCIFGFGHQCCQNRIFAAKFSRGKIRWFVKMKTQWHKLIFTKNFFFILLSKWNQRTPLHFWSVTAKLSKKAHCSEYGKGGISQKLFWSNLLVNPRRKKNHFFWVFSFLQLQRKFLLLLLATLWLRVTLFFLLFSGALNALNSFARWG